MPRYSVAQPDDIANLNAALNYLLELSTVGKPIRQRITRLLTKNGLVTPCPKHWRGGAARRTPSDSASGSAAAAAVRVGALRVAVARQRELEHDGHLPSGVGHQMPGAGG